MDCSRCGGDLEVYSLGDKEAYVCADCGFVDTPVEHEIATQSQPEPWERALQRFYDKHVDQDAAIVGSGETAALVKIDRSEEPTVVPTDEAGETNDEDAAQLVNGEPETTEETTDDDGSADEADQRSDGERATGEADDDTTDKGDEAKNDETDDATDETDEAKDDGTAGDEQAA